MVQPLYQKNLLKTLGDQTAEAKQENSKERPATFSSLCPLTACFPQKPKIILKKYNVMKYFWSILEARLD